MSVVNHQNCSEEIKIVTIDSALGGCLHTNTEEIQMDELSMAQEIFHKLFLALQPYFPAAGLAAPQIGINKAMFIFSFDRDPKHLEAVINPSFIPIGDTKTEGWEACLSVILSVWKLAKISRYESIKVRYLNLQGERIEKQLDGFAAKVFQHEYDHTQGIVNIQRADAFVKEFTTKEDLLGFMQQVKREDALRYKSPSAE